MINLGKNLLAWPLMDAGARAGHPAPCFPIRLPPWRTRSGKYRLLPSVSSFFSLFENGFSRSPKPAFEAALTIKYLSTRIYPPISSKILQEPLRPWESRPQRFLLRIQTSNKTVMLNKLTLLYLLRSGWKLDRRSKVELTMMRNICYSNLPSLIHFLGPYLVLSF